jgi:indole-3-glycerol phosphate synthase
MRTILDDILEDVRAELAAARAARPPAEIRARLADALPTRDFAGALAGDGLGLIAEIKEKSPSVGAMRWENVTKAPAAYEECPLVRAVSILTNHTHFGGSIDHLAVLRQQLTKPVLRKDFLLEDYQVREARAFGADAILLMASVLEPGRLRGLWEVASELEMAVLFEVHDENEIATLPSGAQVVGINSRRFRSRSGFTGAAGHSEKDFSIYLEAFDLGERLPAGCLKVAESGLRADNVDLVKDRFHAALVGTSLLRDERGIHAALAEFQEALA